jgi:hypothetical protein
MTIRLGRLMTSVCAVALAMTLGCASECDDLSCGNCFVDKDPVATAALILVCDEVKNNGTSDECKDFLSVSESCQ